MGNSIGPAAASVHHHSSLHLMAMYYLKPCFESEMMATFSLCKESAASSLFIIVLKLCNYVPLSLDLSFRGKKKEFIIVSVVWQEFRRSWITSSTWTSSRCGSVRSTALPCGTLAMMWKTSGPSTLSLEPWTTLKSSWLICMTKVGQEMWWWIITWWRGVEGLPSWNVLNSC